MLDGQSNIAELDAPRFRGEFLQCCAQIEDHLCSALDRLTDLGEIKRHPYLFGQKFERIRNAASLPGLWKHKDQVSAILAELAPFVELRGALGHAVMSAATVDGQNAVSWHPPGRSDWANRQTMTVAEMRTTLERLRSLTMKLLKQPLAGKG